MMNDLISRQAAIDALLHHGELENDYTDLYHDGYCDGIYDSCDVLEDLPSAQHERKKGKWVWDENGMDWNLGAWVCSECHARNDNIPPAIKYNDGYRKVGNPYMWQGSNFCPNCGADMRGEEK